MEELTAANEGHAKEQKENTEIHKKVAERLNKQLHEKNAEIRALGGESSPERLRLPTWHPAAM